jgi:hypothetical protein
MDSSTKETSKFSIAISTAILVAVVATILVTLEVNSYVIGFGIPIFAYVLCIAMSAIYQTIACGSIQLATISIGDLGVLVSTAVATGILGLETLPLLKYIYGEYPDTSLTPSSLEHSDPEKHYKVQFFTNIVKAVIPPSVNDTMQTGIVYFYWTFWMTLVPYYFVLSLQGMC